MRPALTCYQNQNQKLSFVLQGKQETKKLITVINRDTKIPDKIFINQIQQFIKKQCILTKWVLAQECKVGLMLDNQPMEFTKKKTILSASSTKLNRSRIL